MTEMLENHMGEGPGRQAMVWSGLLAALFLLFLAAEWASFRESGAPRRFPDTGGYLQKSEEPFFSKAFQLSGKPNATPLLYKLVQRREAVIARSQSLLSVLCWFSFALAVAGELQHRAIRIAAVIAVCLFSISLPVNQWDYVLLSESLSFSLLALTLALTIVLSRRLASETGRLRAWCGIWGASCLLLSWTRDSCIYLLATLWGGFALWFAVDTFRRLKRSRRVHRDLLGALLVLSAIVVAGHQVAYRTERWQDPLTNLVTGRVLPQRHLYHKWVKRYGLPRNPVFEQYVGKKAWERSRTGPPIRERFWNHDPEVEDVHTWLLERGRSSYIRFLFWDHAAESLRISFRAFADQVNSRRTEKHFGQGAGRTAWTAALTEWTFARIGHPVGAWAVVLAIAVVFAVRLPAGRLLSLLSFFLACNAWVQAFINFHGDTSNLDRHMVACGVYLRLAFLCLALVALDQVPRLLRRLGGEAGPGGARTRSLSGSSRDGSA